jgi:hypothetical protein
MLDSIIRHFDRMAEDHKTHTGLEALVMRSYEQVSKVSFILSVPEGVRTVEHVRWALALVKHDLNTKLRMVTANDREKDAPALAMKARVAQIISGDNGETIGVIANRMRGFKRPEIEACLKKMVERGEAVEEEATHPYNKKKIVRYKLVDGD